MSESQSPQPRRVRVKRGEPERGIKIWNSMKNALQTRLPGLFGSNKPQQTVPVKDSLDNPPAAKSLRDTKGEIQDLIKTSGEQDRARTDEEGYAPQTQHFGGITRIPRAKLVDKGNNYEVEAAEEVGANLEQRVHLQEARNYNIFNAVEPGLDDIAESDEEEATEEVGTNLEEPLSLEEEREEFPWRFDEEGKRRENGRTHEPELSPLVQSKDEYEEEEAFIYEDEEKYNEDDRGSSGYGSETSASEMSERSNSALDFSGISFDFSGTDNTEEQEKFVTPLVTPLGTPTASQDSDLRNSLTDFAAIDYLENGDEVLESQEKEQSPLQNTPATNTDSRTRSHSDQDLYSSAEQYSVPGLDESKKERSQHAAEHLEQPLASFRRPTAPPVAAATPASSSLSGRISKYLKGTEKSVIDDWNRLEKNARTFLKSRSGNYKVQREEQRQSLLKNTDTFNPIETDIEQDFYSTEDENDHSYSTYMDGEQENNFDLIDLEDYEYRGPESSGPEFSDNVEKKVTPESSERFSNTVDALTQKIDKQMVLSKKDEQDILKQVEQPWFSQEAKQVVQHSEGSGSDLQKETSAILSTAVTALGKTNRFKTAAGFTTQSSRKGQKGQAEVNGVQVIVGSPIDKMDEQLESGKRVLENSEGKDDLKTADECKAALSEARKFQKSQSFKTVCKVQLIPGVSQLVEEFQTHITSLEETSARLEKEVIKDRMKGTKEYKKAAGLVGKTSGKEVIVVGELEVIEGSPLSKMAKHNEKCTDALKIKIGETAAQKVGTLKEVLHEARKFQKSQSFKAVCRVKSIPEVSELVENSQSQIATIEQNLASLEKGLAVEKLITSKEYSQATGITEKNAN